MVNQDSLMGTFGTVEYKNRENFKKFKEEKFKKQRVN